MIPDYSESFLAADRALRDCHKALIDHKDLERAAVHAEIANQALRSLALDIELRLAKVRR